MMCVRYRRSGFSDRNIILREFVPFRSSEKLSAPIEGNRVTKSLKLFTKFGQKIEGYLWYFSPLDNFFIHWN